MSNPPPGGYQGGGGYPPPGGYQGYPPPGGYQGGGAPPTGSAQGKTKVLGLDYNVAGLLCYIPYCCCCINLIACILWLVTEPKESRFVRFHALQGLLLGAAGFLVGLVFRILGVGAQLGTQVGTGSELASAGVGLVVLILALVINLTFLILFIVAMIKAYQGEMWKLPVIGDIAEKNS